MNTFRAMYISVLLSRFMKYTVRKFEKRLNSIVPEDFQSNLRSSCLKRKNLRKYKQKISTFVKIAQFSPHFGALCESKNLVCILLVGSMCARLER